MMKKQDDRRWRVQAGAIRAAALALFLILGGMIYALGDLPLAHTETVELGGIENLSINYGHHTVILRESETADLVLKEYMNRDNPRYYARISRSGGTVQIQRGRRPLFFWNWKVKVEIYLPRSFQGNLRLSNSSGSLSADVDLLDYRSIDVNVNSGTVFLKNISGGSVSVHVASGEMDIGALGGNSFVSVSSGRLRIGSITGEENRVKVSSGRLRIGALEGHGILELSSGNMAIDRVRGRVEVDISSGGLELGDFSGKGAFNISSGNLTLDLRDLEGDLHFLLSSGRVDVTIPKAIPFNLDMVTRSGTVRVKEGLEEVLKISGNSTVLRPIGPSPERTIFARTTSGDLTINRR
ncbi:MAG: DUF4097 domain-containing protein [Treponema sp.]|jgi:hypothetical protein|nr:DUF4097 domain-containing protein [Treponema sp.]